MDWAIKAAKKRMRTRHGDSRSIVESLNKLNDTVLTGHDEINELLEDANDWLNLEMRRVGFKEEAIESAASADELFSGSLQDKVDKELAGGNLDSSLNQQDNTNSKVSINADKEKAEDEDPKVKLHLNVSRDDEKPKNYGSNTPKSSKSTLNRAALKSSPWSPYKVERTLKEGVYSQIQNDTQDAQDAQDAQDTQDTQDAQDNDNSINEVDQGTDKSITETKISLSKSSESTTSFKAATVVPPSRDRTLRRSNMFVPLPNKDPLVVQPSTGKGKALNLNAPDAPKPLQGSMQRGSSIFDRLSSIPTKSFEKKISLTRISRSPSRISRSPVRLQSPSARRYPQTPSQANANGSPVRRRSTAVGDRSNDKIQATLKGIFDTRIPTLASEKLAANAPLSDNKKKAAQPKLERKSLIPRLDRPSLKSSINKEKRGRSMTPIKRPDMASKLRKLSANPSPVNKQSLNSTQKLQPSATPLRVASKPFLPMAKSTLTSDLNPSPEYRSTVQSPIPKVPGLIGTKLSLKIPSTSSTTKLALTHSDSSPFVKAAATNSIGNQSIVDETSPGSKSANIPLKGPNDRLTKFQLVSQAGSEKHDLKRKLDKRLSEVMRNQQEQQLLRRRQEQQKRKSQLEEEKNRRTKILSEFAENPVGSRPKAKPSNTYLSKLPNQSILYDLNTADHRSNIGAKVTDNNPNMENSLPLGETTLPYIDSDSDNESGSHKVLAAWAQSPYLESQLKIQQDWDAEKIFGPIPPLHVDEIFQNSRLSRLKSRQSATRISMGI
ncbi:HDR032Cp [Eremothecium sinecaudum]|uniref:HDR032Cp n=1 Tax=Eremothecium sinecaudum TaxID=45286 RepID=A0A120K290_9SACH|nr:HDR032Cp [Eremothecium sinecaudum]AMD20775.1 HDR032Cp [Eremothecium sinecaudum]